FFRRFHTGDNNNPSSNAGNQPTASISSIQQNVNIPETNEQPLCQRQLQT
ncbi:unnamed protein product, partial [Adineta steineri]